MTDPEHFDTEANRALREGAGPTQLLQLYIDSEAIHDPARARQLELRLEAIRTQALVDIAAEIHGLVVGLATIVTEAPQLISNGLAKCMNANPAELVAFRSMFRTSLGNLEAAIRDLVEVTSHK